jgi:hypothetical protein
MPGFLFKVWSLARPCRARFFLGVLTGIVSGLTAPLMIGSIMKWPATVVLVGWQTGVVFVRNPKSRRCFSSLKSLSCVSESPSATCC